MTKKIKLAIIYPALCIVKGRLAQPWRIITSWFAGQRKVSLAWYTARREWRFQKSYLCCLGRGCQDEQLNNSELKLKFSNTFVLYLHLAEVAEKNIYMLLETKIMLAAKKHQEKRKVFDSCHLCCRSREQMPTELYATTTEWYVIIETKIQTQIWIFLTSEQTKGKKKIEFPVLNLSDVCFK